MSARNGVTKSLLMGVGAMLAATLATEPLQAQEGFVGRAWVGSVGRYVLNDNDPFTAPGFGSALLKVDGSALGFGGDLEYRFNRWFGVDAGVGYSKLNVHFTNSTEPGVDRTSGFGVVPLMFAVNVHLIDAKYVDVWAGPEIAYVVFPDKLTYAASGGRTFSYAPTNVFNPEGFVVAADIKLSNMVAVNAAFRWQDADGDSDGHLKIDPTFVTVGLSWRFFK